MSDVILTLVDKNSPLASDTSLDAARVQVEVWRRMSSVDKVRAVAEVTDSVLALALAGIRERNPGATDRECELRLAALKVGGRLACRAFPEVARLHGRRD